MSWHFKISYLCNMNQRIHIANLGFASAIQMNLIALGLHQLCHQRNHNANSKRIVQSCQRIVHARKRIVQLREMGGYIFIIIINNSKPIRSYVIKISIDPAAQPEGCR